MKRALLVLTALALAACESPTQPAPTAPPAPGGPLGATTLDAKGGNPVVHHVSASGADLCATEDGIVQTPGCDANFTLSARVFADGSASGQYQDTFKGGGQGVHIAIDCVNVDGNSAVVSGIATHGSYGGGDATGRRFATAVVDNGTSAKDPPDQISFTNPVSDGFDCQLYTAVAFSLFDHVKGQVSVR